MGGMGENATIEVADIWLSNLEEDELEKYVWHFDMLNHEARHTAYIDAFKRLPKSFPTSGPALDLGCGSGLLGLMLKHNGCPLKILSVEADKALASVAKKNVEAADLGRQIEVKACMSTKIPSMEGQNRSSLAIHELFDSPLLGEAVLPTLRDASRRLLAPGYYSVPSRAEVWGVLVESTFLRSYQDAPSHLPMPQSWRRDSGGSYPHEVNFFRLEEAKQCRRLTSPFHAFSIDFENLPPASGQHVLCHVPAIADGSADAIVFWWRCAMLRGDKFDDDPSKPKLHNEPGNSEDPDHWRQAFCVLPRPPSGHFVKTGDSVAVVASHNDDLIWFQAEPNQATVSKEILFGPPLCLEKQEPFQPQTNLGCLSEWRLRSLNNLPRCRWLRRQYLRILPKVLDGPILDLSAGGVALFLRRQDKLSFGSLQHQRVSRRRSSRRRRRLAICSLKSRRKSLKHPSKSRGALSLVCLASRIERRLGREIMPVGRRSSESALSIEFKPQSWRPNEPAAALLAEPFDRLVEQRECDLQLWQHWAQVQDLLPTLNPSSIVFPRRFKLHVALLSCARLWQGRQLLKGKLPGGVAVDHMDELASSRFMPFAEETDAQAQVDGQQAQGRRRFPCELWQQDHFVLRSSGSSAALATVDVVTTAMQPLLQFEPCILTVENEMLQQVGVHGLATWTEVEPSLPHGSGHSPSTSSWSTANFVHIQGNLERVAPGPFKQGAILARNPRWASRERLSRMGMNNLTTIRICGCFDATRGEVRLHAHWYDTGLEF